MLDRQHFQAKFPPHSVPQALVFCWGDLAKLALEKKREEITMVSPEASLLGARIDEHHLPETNGRMAVCRRCGAQTQGPEGHHHVPNELLLAHLSDWLDAQTRTRHIDRARDSLNR